MLIFLLIFLCITTHILLGSYVAIYFGFGPPDWRTALNQVIDFPRFQDYWSIFRTRISKLPVFRKKNPPSSSVENSHSGSNTTSGKTTPQQTGLNFNSSNSFNKYGEISDRFPNQENSGNEFTSIFTDQETQDWLVQEGHVETFLLKLNLVMLKSGIFSAELDERIRLLRGTMTPDDVHEFLNELKNDCRNYLESQADITEQMKKRLDEFGVLKNLAEEIDYANMEQSAQIETTLNNLDYLDLSNNPEENALRLIKEISSLRLVRNRLRDMQNRTFIHIIFSEKREETIPTQFFIDENSGIYNRIGIEMNISQWWKQKLHEKKQITFALLDFVKFGEANEEHGITVCNQVLKFFSGVLKERFDPQDLIGIYSGNCFLVATISSSPKKTIAEIERIRQRFEKTIFRFRGKETMRLQLTCAITEALGTQSKNDVLAALEKTLVAAKKAGRNHTFYYVPGPLGHSPDKIDAPDFGEEEIKIDLA
ncbi:MAG: GGDEF domain-containing protein [Planctomycetaceae bacterium]|nr:GGDEF domain-containing protein [Planctomycetaceae bacterium]